MQPSPNIRSELEKCADLLAQLEQASSISEFEDLWQRLLGHLERVWNKCQSHFSKSPKWNGWKGRYETQRRQDALLSYLTNARGAHEHTVGDITARVPGSVQIGAGPGGYAHVRSLRIGPKGVEGDWDGDLAVTFSAARIDPLPVKNRGRDYPVPTSHLGKALESTSVISLGRAGFSYYRDLVSKAEGFFC